MSDLWTIDEVLHDLRLLAESSAHPQMAHRAINFHAEHILTKYKWPNPHDEKEGS